MKKVLTIVVIVFVVAGVGTVAYLQFGPQRVKAEAAVTGQTATVTRGSLAATVSGAGNIAAHQQVALNFQQTGPIKQIYVQAGSRVQAGQVLAELDDSDLQLQLQNAEVNLKIAQDKLAQTKSPTTSEDIASARAQVDAAQAAYDKVVAGATPADISAAKSQVASAQAAYSAAVNSANTSNSQLEAAAAAMQKAQVALQQAQAAYDKVASNPGIGAMSQSVNLQSATIDYQQAKANYDALAATTNSDAASKVESAKSALDQAQASLVKLQQVTPADVTTAQANLTQAKNNLQKLLAGPDAASLDIAQNGVDQAQIALKQAQLQVQKAQLIAPFTGIITAVDVTNGQDVSGNVTGGAMQLADLDNLEISVNMAETDVSSIKMGQQVQVTLDALPDQNLTGIVTQISPAGVLNQGVVNYPVTIALQNPPAAVKTGMTANVNIVTAQRNDVLMLPNRAIRTLGRQKVATVLFEGQQMQVPVTTGLANDTQTEVTSGLKEGDVVMLTTTTITAGGGGARIGGPGGFVGGFGR
jgi:HlyD family secretion protein